MKLKGVWSYILRGFFLISLWAGLVLLGTACGGGGGGY